MDNFEKAVEFILELEDYWGELPGDPGGLTIWGISARSYPKDVDKMKTMSKDEAREYAKYLYRHDYWNMMFCDKMPWPMNLVVFDTAVNGGRARAKSFYAAGLTWQDYLCKRVKWQVHQSVSRYTASLLNRIYKVFNLANEGG